jgi:predicted glycogen debranching enzyme
MNIDDRTEWLEADGLGGFASGTVSGVHTRRYHALLLHATTPPTGRVVLVNGFDAWVDTPAGSFALSTQRYAPDVLHPDGASRITRFVTDPWPTWEYELADGTCIRQELFVRHGTSTVMVIWMLLKASGPVTLRVRPFLSGRDYHALHHENGAFSFDADVHGAMVRFRGYDGVPAVIALSNADYRHSPDWYRRFLYSLERERGLDDTEDLASPGEFQWSLNVNERAFWALRANATMPDPPLTREQLVVDAADAEAAERRRRAAFATPLDRAADAYLVRRGAGQTIVAGYPWFTDWGRDTFIALRGLCLATNRLADASAILLEWAGAVSQGMLPNRFPDGGEAPEFNSVDASLWYVVAVQALLQRATRASGILTPAQRLTLEAAITEIVSGYAAGTRFGIRMDADGLLSAGVDGVQLTWMDARVGDRVITPRIGKPVEVQALWLNAVDAVAPLDGRWDDVLARGRLAFAEKFWNERLGRLADVVDVNHVPGARDDSFRPNQILAVGGLPLALIEGARARRIVDQVEAHLLTPAGLRSLAPGEPGYAAAYVGDSSARDAVYHQGTVWPWLIGPFVEAWVRVRGNAAKARKEARARFVQPLIAQAQSLGGHLPEIADAEAPFAPKGCPFQAWSLGEILRLDRSVLSATGRSAHRRPGRCRPLSVSPRQDMTSDITSVVPAREA